MTMPALAADPFSVVLVTLTGLASANVNQTYQEEF